MQKLSYFFYNWSFSPWPLLCLLQIAWSTRFQMISVNSDGKLRPIQNFLLVLQFSLVPATGVYTRSSALSSGRYSCLVCSLIVCWGDWTFPISASLEKSVSLLGFHGPQSMLPSSSLCLLLPPLPHIPLTFFPFFSSLCVSLFLSLMPWPPNSLTHTLTIYWAHSKHQLYKNY